LKEQRIEGAEDSRSRGVKEQRIEGAEE